MTKELLKEIAKKLNGVEYGHENTRINEKELKENGIVVVYGYSDDNCELRGAINDEIGCFQGGTIYLNSEGIIEECSDECKYYLEAIKRAKKIEIISGNYWTYETDVPHEIFNVYEVGEDEDENIQETLYCKGIVFCLNNLDKDTSN